MAAPGDRPTAVRRRRVLASIGGVTVTALAGCSGTDDESENDGSDGSDDGQGDDGPTDDDGQSDDGSQGDDGGQGGDDDGQVDDDEGQGDESCPEWSELERVDLSEYGIADFPVVPEYPVGWEETNSFVEPDEAIFAVGDPELINDLGQSVDYVSIQVELIEADGEVPPWDDWPTKDWSEVEDETDPIEFEGEQRPVGLVEREAEAIWRFSAAGPNDTHMLVSVIVRVSSEACLSGMLDLGRAVLDGLELNHESEI